MGRKSGRLRAITKSENEKTKVIIIGAGVAGLSAASYLEEEYWSKIHVTVLEGRDRTGLNEYCY